MVISDRLSARLSQHPEAPAGLAHHVTAQTQEVTVNVMQIHPMFAPTSQVSHLPNGSVTCSRLLTCVNSASPFHELSASSPPRGPRGLVCSFACTNAASGWLDYFAASISRRPVPHSNSEVSQPPGVFSQFIAPYVEASPPGFSYGRSWPEHIFLRSFDRRLQHDALCSIQSRHRTSTVVSSILPRPLLLRYLNHEDRGRQLSHRSFLSTALEIGSSGLARS